jgi:hypothetical protein
LIAADISRSHHLLKFKESRILAMNRRTVLIGAVFCLAAGCKPKGPVLSGSWKNVASDEVAVFEPDGRFWQTFSGIKMEGRYMVKGTEVQIQFDQNPQILRTDKWSVSSDGRTLTLEPADSAAGQLEVSTYSRQ